MSATMAAPKMAKPDDFRAGTYVTDGKHLFTVERVWLRELGPGQPAQMAVTLENCKTAMHLTVPLVEVVGTLRLVKPE